MTPSLDAILMRGSIAAWLLCLACLAPAIWRIVCRRPRLTDPIWCLVSLLAINRLLFLIHVPREIAHGTAIALAMSMAALTLSYQRHDRRCAP